MIRTAGFVFIDARSTNCKTLCIPFSAIWLKGFVSSIYTVFL
jgi:hypothetical protein